MKHIIFYFDVISPYAYLAFEHLPEALKGLNYRVTYQPVLLAGLLKHHGQLGPAEIEPKRVWTYRQVLWQARQLDIQMQMPAAHPFNPLALLRLAVACDSLGLPNRYEVETLFHHIWRGGGEAEDKQRLEELTNTLSPATDPNGQEVKDLLKTHTENAIQKGVFGVPSVEVDGNLFFGLDGLPMLAAYLRGDSWFNSADWEAVKTVRTGIRRQ